VNIPLDAGREGQFRLAVYDAHDARDGDPAEFRQRCEQVVDLHFRLIAEHFAEQGYIPETFGGCVAVLHVAARILELIGQDNA
jgi:hypothetical protein